MRDQPLDLRLREQRHHKLDIAELRSGAEVPVGEMAFELLQHVCIDVLDVIASKEGLNMLFENVFVL